MSRGLQSFPIINDCFHGCGVFLFLLSSFSNFYLLSVVSLCVSFAVYCYLNRPIWIEFAISPLFFSCSSTIVIQCSLDIYYIEIEL